MHGFDIIESKDPLKDIVKLIEADKLETIGFDNQVSFAYYQGLQALLAIAVSFSFEKSVCLIYKWFIHFQPK